MAEVWFWVAAVVAASLVGMGKGGVPIVGMLAVPVMALVMNPVAAAGMLLPVYVVSDMFGLTPIAMPLTVACWRSFCPGRLPGSGWVWRRQAWCPRRR